MNSEDAANLKLIKGFAMRLNNIITIIFILIMMSISSFALAPDYSNALTYYKFDSTILDNTSRGQHLKASIGSTAYVAGKLGNALDCDGDSFQNITSSYNMNAIRTVEYWIKFDSTVANADTIHFRNIDDLDVWYWSASSAFYKTYIGGTVENTPQITDSRWYHYIHFLNLDSRYIIYRNGTMIYNSSNAALLASSTAYTICSFATGGDHLNGQMDNLIFYNATPTNATVQAWVDDAYNNGIGRVLAPAEPVSIANSSFNVTNYPDLISNSTAWNTPNAYINVSKNLITATFTLSVNANSSCSIHNLNYTAMIALNSNYKSATTTAASHSFTLYDNLTVFNSTTCIYCAYSTGSIYAQSGCLKTMFSDVNSPFVSFISQTPIDITDTNGFIIGAIIRYNAADRDSNISSVLLKEFINTTNGAAYYCERNICSYANFSLNYSSIFEIDYRWNISDNLLYVPAIYNIDERYMESVSHSALSSQSVKIDFTQVSSSLPHNFLEIMANGTTGTKNVYYCNSSYVTGNFQTSSNCITFFSLLSSIPYNHSHSIFSQHKLIPFSILNGKIGTVAVTNISHFIFDGTGTWNYYYITNNTSTFSSSNNNGITWALQSGTIDSHIHQFSSDNSICYNIYSSDYYRNINYTETRCDNMDITNFPPSTVNVYSPSIGLYNDTVEINYTNSSVFNINNAQLEYYLIDLYSTDETTLIQNIINNSLELGYLFDSSDVADGNYKIKVTAYDNNSLFSESFSPNFSIDSSLLAINAASPINWTPYIMGVDTIRIRANCTGSTSLSMNVSIYSGSDIIYEYSNAGNQLNQDYAITKNWTQNLYYADIYCTDLSKDISVLEEMIFPIYTYFNISILVPSINQHFFVPDEITQADINFTWMTNQFSYCCDAVNDIWIGCDYVPADVETYNQYLLTTGTYNITRACTMVDTTATVQDYRIIHVEIPIIPFCFNLSITQPYFDENVTITANLTTSELSWVEFIWNGTQIYNISIIGDSIIRQDSIKNKIKINDSFEYGYNFSDSLNYVVSCYNTDVSIEREYAPEPTYLIGGCPETLVSMLVIGLSVLIALFFIALGYIMRNLYLPLFGWILLIVASFYMIGCIGLYAGIVILISILMILLTAISAKYDD